MEDVVPGEEANTLESAVLETLNSPQLHWTVIPRTASPMVEPL